MAPSTQSNDLAAFNPIVAAKNALKQKLAKMQADIKSLRNNIETLNKAEAQVKRAARDASKMSEAKTALKIKVTKQRRFKHFCTNPAQPTDKHHAYTALPRKLRWIPFKTQHMVGSNMKVTQTKINYCRGKCAATSEKEKVIDGWVKLPTKIARRNNLLLSTPVGPRAESLEAISAEPKPNFDFRIDRLRRSERLKKKSG